MTPRLSLLLPLLTLSSLLACGDKDETTADGGSADGGASDGGTGDGGGDGGTTGTVECENNVCIVTGTITEDQVWTSDKAWLLRGGVFIGDDTNPTTLTIEPGTTVYGESATDGMLVIRRNSRILAEGTRDAPIVFTSSKSPGSRARGDWGGLIINGKAPINACAEGGEGCEAFGEGGTGWYGGDDPTDDSGVLRYVRVEFAGTLISPDNELNGIAFQAVGSGTTIEYIQVHMNADDGIEFFGGTAQAKYILLTGIGDDNLDWTDGWQGKLQFLVAKQYDDNGDNGIEADNNAEDNAAEPFSAPTISHVTIIGSPDSSSSDIGMLLREGTKGQLSNVIVTGFNEACLDVDHDQTWANGASGELSLTRSIVWCATNYIADGDAGSVESWFLAGTGNQAADPKLTGAYNLTSPSFVPGSGSPALSGGQAPADSFFTAASFIGGVDPSNDWTVGWTTSAAN